MNHSVFMHLFFIFKLCLGSKLADLAFDENTRGHCMSFVTSFSLILSLSPSPSLS